MEGTYMENTVICEGKEVQPDDSELKVSALQETCAQDLNLENQPNSQPENGQEMDEPKVDGSDGSANFLSSAEAATDGDCLLTETQEKFELCDSNSSEENKFDKENVSNASGSLLVVSDQNDVITNSFPETKSTNGENNSHCDELISSDACVGEREASPSTGVNYSNEPDIGASDVGKNEKPLDTEDVESSHSEDGGGQHSCRFEGIEAGGVLQSDATEASSSHSSTVSNMKDQDCASLHKEIVTECVNGIAHGELVECRTDNSDNCTTASDTTSSSGMDGSEMQRIGYLSDGSQTSECYDVALMAESPALEPLDTTVLPNGLNENVLVKFHPVHQKLQSEMVSLQRKCNHQAEQISRLQTENSKLVMELAEKSSQSVPTSTEIYEVQMEALEKTILQLQRELEAHKTKLATHDETAKKTIAQLHKDLGGRLDQMTKWYESANKDKETMVIKFAQSHKEVLNLKKAFDELERKAKEGMKEKELLQLKLKNLGADRNRICQCLSAKNSELECAVRENEKLKEQLNSKDIKIKWAQNKLRMEMDSHKETEQKLEKLQQKLHQTREEAEQIRRDCKEMIRTYQESEDIKSNSLDLQLKERESELKLERQEKTDQEEVYVMLRRELDALKKNHKLSIEENNNLTMKVQVLERERLEYETNLSRIKELNNSHKQEVVDLCAKLSEMDNLQAQLERQKEIATVNQQEIERLREANTELQNDMDACRFKEGELLEFTERLTSKNVTLQSEYATMEAKNQMLQMEQNRINKLNHNLEEENSSVKAKLEEEQQLRHQETQLLARKLAEKTRSAETLSLKLEEEANENKVMKRRHVASIKELTREIQQLKRRLESTENSSGLNAGSRTSSSGSLDNCATNSSLAGINNPSLNSQIARTPRTVLVPTSEEREFGTVMIEPTQIVIERIVKLQKVLARKNEKIEFLEEHISSLDKELRKKSRIIQSYVMRLEPGALATTKMDWNKMEVAKKGGIMASVYSSHAIDAAMTLDLSLEINRKLQAVLEDTLLKNITLKENISTLGEEIARLTNAEKVQ